MLSTKWVLLFLRYACRVLVVQLCSVAIPMPWKVERCRCGWHDPKLANVTNTIRLGEDTTYRVCSAGPLIISNGRSH